jgi:organic hydroperoxide reductase OsmC/OhrA
MSLKPSSYGRTARKVARNNPALRVATPPGFGGPEGAWSPEELFVASVESCLLSTFLYFTERFDIALTSYSSNAKGSLEKTGQGLRFKGIDVSIAIAVPDEETAGKVTTLRLKEKLEKYCPVSTSLGCPVRIDLAVTVGR